MAHDIAVCIYRRLCEVCSTKLLQAPILLGGPGGVVQIDESLTGGPGVVVQIDESLTAQT